MTVRRVNIIGSGNVAAFFAKNLYRKGIAVETIYSFHLKNAEELATIVNARPADDVKQLSAGADLNIIAVKDDAIAGVAATLDKKVPVVHTSGSIGIEVLKAFSAYGITYPLQTISKQRVDALKQVPFLVEANTKAFTDQLIGFCNDNFEGLSIEADSKLRSEVHLAAVFANNFSNFFLTRAKDVLDRSGVDFEILRPLMIETVEKAFESGPSDSQTGPAKRGDLSVLKSQLERVGDVDLKEVYRLISNLIAGKSNLL